MANIDPEESALYSRADQLHPATWETLAQRSPEEVREAADCGWDGESFLLPLLGQRLAVSPRLRSVDRQGAGKGHPVGYQRALVAVSYLAHAVGVDPRGDWVTPRELPGGDAFFRGPHSLATPKLEATFGSRPEKLLAAADRVGARPVEGADAALEIPALPRVPMRLLLWAGTEEFSPSANLLIDPRAHLHLALDVVWALTNLLISDLTKELV